MKKLNKRKIRWIVKEVERRCQGVWTIAHQQDISERHARRVHKKYRNDKDPALKKCGRKLRIITDEERKMIIDTYKEIRASATMIEQVLDEKGIHVNHNRIHRILLEAGLAKHEQNKQRRRSWVRYERKHSLSLGHGDWFEFKGKHILLIIDDASRFILHCKVYDSASMENSKKGFIASLKYGSWKQFMTDHGSHFVNNEQEGKKFSESSFTELLEQYGAKHIKARIKHPQSNGKAERAVGSIKRLWAELGSLEKAVEQYNFKRPHRSLTNGKLRTPWKAFQEKTRKA